MKINKSTIFAMSVAAAVFAGSTLGASAQSIGAHFVSAGGGGIVTSSPDALLATNVAGAPPFAQANWNNLGSYGISVPINDANGNATGLLINWDSGGAASTGAYTTLGTADGKLNDGFIYSWGPGAESALADSVYNSTIANKPLVYLSGLNAWCASIGAYGYQIVVYISGYGYYAEGEEYVQSVSGNPVTDTMVAGTDLTPHFYDYDGATFAGTYVQCTATNSAAASSGPNYIVFSNLTADGVLIRNNDPTGGYGFGVNGFQIIPLFTGPPTLGAHFVNAGGGGIVTNSPDALVATNVAGAPSFAQANWNDLGSYGISVPLNDSRGNPTGLLVNWDSGGAASTGAYTTLGTADGKLNDGFIYSWGPGAESALADSVYNSTIANKPLVYLSGLNGWCASNNASAYDIVVYISGYGYYAEGEEYVQSVSGNPVIDTMVAGTDLTPHFYDYDGATFAGTYVQCTATNSAAASSGPNYIVFSNLTADGVLIRNNDPTGGYGFGVNGFQIIPLALTEPVVSTPVANANPAYGLSQLLLSDAAEPAGTTTYQWQTNSDLTGGLGGTWGTVAGATATNLTFPLPDGTYTLDFQFIATNSNGSVTSAVVAVSVQPSSKPTLVQDTTPKSLLLYSGLTATFNASFAGTTPITNQWQTDSGQSGTFTNIPLATNTTLTFVDVQPGNAGNYRLVASNALGSASSTPASLVVLPVLYLQPFSPKPESTNEPVSDVGWRNDITGSDGNIRDFSNRNGLTLPTGAVYSYDGVAANEAFYTTTLTENGTIAGQMPFPSIPVATATNLTFFVDVSAELDPGNNYSLFAVQMNGNAWYVDNTTPLAPATSAFTPFSLQFSPNAANWYQVTFSGTGSDDNPSFPGLTTSSPGADLTGNITGAGIVCIHSALSTSDYEDFAIAGAVPITSLPVINAEPESATNYSGATGLFEVSAATNGPLGGSVAGLTYYWQSRAGASGSFANLSDGGQYTGSLSNILTVANLSSSGNNQEEFQVVVTDGAGSVTSTPPAVLTVLAQAPTIVTDTTITPNGVTASNNNIVQFAASFAGSQPISYQWQISPNSDGSGAVSVPGGATNNTLALTIVSTSQGGYYSLQANNGIGSPVNSTWTQLTVEPASSAVYQWSAPVSITGLTAAQILEGFPGVYFEAEAFGGTAETVQVGNTTYNFASGGTSAFATGGVGTATGALTGTTGNTSLDAALNGFYYDNNTGNTHQITLENLTVGELYSAQLFGLDDRTGGESSRLLSYQDPNNSLDISATFTEGGNYYVLGTFTASSSTMTIQQNLITSDAGNINAVVVRAIPPAVTLQLTGTTLTINLNYGALLQATNLLGPWTTNTGTSPYTITTTTNAAMFFQAVSP